MDFQIICGVLIGVTVTLLIWICIVKWRQGKAIRKGRQGERIVAKSLRKLRKKETVILNDLIFPAANGRTSQVDHVVVTTRGIFVIETKSLAGRITGGEHAQYWTQHFSSGSRQFYNPILQNRGHLKTLRRLLPDLDEDLFTSMVIFTEAWRLDIKADEIIEPRRFFPDRHIKRTFIPSERKKRHWWCPSREVRLDERNIVAPLDELAKEIERRPKIIPKEDLERIVEKINGHAIQDNKIAGTHTAYARDTSKNISREIRQGICPRCGGQLIVRKSQNGDFVGCANYPSCRFYCSIDRLH